MVPRTKVLAFDVYGTLIDPLAIADVLRAYVEDQADRVAALWRQKQVEYAFRRGLMRAYADFDVCTRQALLFATESCGVTLMEEDHARLLNTYRQLPAYPDVAPALAALHEQGYQCVAFTNGVGPTVRALLDTAGLGTVIEDIISVDDERTFKPDPAVYHYLVRRVGGWAQDIWLVSANSWDVIGAQAVGLRTAWVHRTPTTYFDPWGVTPDVEVGHLGELLEKVRFI